MASRTRAITISTSPNPGGLRKGMRISVTRCRFCLPGPGLIGHRERDLPRLVREGGPGPAVDGRPGRPRNSVSAPAVWVSSPTARPPGGAQALEAKGGEVGRLRRALTPRDHAGDEHGRAGQPSMPTVRITIASRTSSGRNPRVRLNQRTTFPSRLIIAESVLPPSVAVNRTITSRRTVTPRGSYLNELCAELKENSVAGTGVSMAPIVSNRSRTAGRARGDPHPPRGAGGEAEGRDAAAMNCQPPGPVPRRRRRRYEPSAR